ncbi:hypothetical protein JTB14_017883 [Gonioctena quinquepunctata]|nr:hypothetical protein JTB14_017883 [Gonioctena quinquepunctata]
MDRYPNIDLTPHIALQFNIVHSPATKGKSRFISWWVINLFELGCCEFIICVTYFTPSYDVVEVLDVFQIFLLRITETYNNLVIFVLGDFISRIGQLFYGCPSVENMSIRCDTCTLCISHMVEFIKKIGGTDGRDHTRRCLKTIFSNRLGEICSWTGQKSNFAVNKLKLTELISDTVHKEYHITQKDFECFTKEWFRHSKQRREREDKRKSSLDINYVL